MRRTSLSSVELRGLVSQAWENLKRIEELVETGIPSSLHEAALRWYLYPLHQNILDALASLLAEAGFRKPASYSELAVPLLEKGCVSSWFTEEISKYARTRSLLAHAYRGVSREDAMEIARRVMVTAPKLLEELAKLAEDLGVDPPPEGGRGLEEVFERYSGIIAALLFGSRARGCSTDESDFDIAILAERPLTLGEAEEIALRLAEALGAPADKVDIVDLQTAPNELLYKVIRDGKLLYTSSEEQFRKWVRETYVKVLDEEESLKESYYAKLRRKIEAAARPSKS